MVPIVIVGRGLQTERAADVAIATVNSYTEDCILVERDQSPKMWPLGI